MVVTDAQNENAPSQPITPIVTTILKVVIVGESGVGKSGLMSRLTRNEFTCDSRPTIGVDFVTMDISLPNGRTVPVVIWDTAGHSRVRTHTAEYYKRATGVLLVYDITDRRSYEKAQGELMQLYDLADDGVVVTLVANKSDRSDLRAVPIEEAQTFAKANKLTFIETSALVSTTDIRFAFHDLVEAMDFGRSLHSADSSDESDFVSESAERRAIRIVGVEIEASCFSFRCVRLFDICVAGAQIFKRYTDFLDLSGFIEGLHSAEELKRFGITDFPSKLWYHSAQVPAAAASFKCDDAFEMSACTGAPTSTSRTERVRQQPAEGQELAEARGCCGDRLISPSVEAYTLQRPLRENNSTQ
jgi:Ras-related protein Rab-11A